MISYIQEVVYMKFYAIGDFAKIISKLANKAKKMIKELLLEDDNIIENQT